MIVRDELDQLNKSSPLLELHVRCRFSQRVSAAVHLERGHAAPKFTHRLAVTAESPIRECARGCYVNFISHIDGSLSFVRRSHAKQPTGTTLSINFLNFRLWRLKVNHHSVRGASALIA